MALILGRFTLGGSELTGDVRIPSVDRLDVSTGHIEILEVTFGARIDVVSGGSMRAASRRRIQPIRLLKPMDGTTPLLYQALTQNQRLDGDVLFLDLDPASGQRRHRFTLRVSQTRLQSVESGTSPKGDVGVEPGPPCDTVELVPHTIAYIDEVHGVEFEDVWSESL